MQHSLKFPIGNLVRKSAAPILKIAALIQKWPFFADTRAILSAAIFCTKFPIGNFRAIFGPFFADTRADV